MIIAESLLHSKVKMELVLGKCKTIGVTCVIHGADTGRHLGAVTSDKGCKGTKGRNTAEKSDAKHAPL